MRSLQRAESSLLQCVTGDQTEDPTSEHLTTDEESSDQENQARVVQEPPHIPIE